MGGTSTILMIKPVQFGFNEIAFETNKFQKRMENISSDETQKQALQEFNASVKILEDLGVEVLVFEDILSNNTPDSIFPNNWISTHDSDLITYPMAVSNRRPERREDIIQVLSERKKYNTISRLEHHENKTAPSYLEGTGSIVFDHENKVAYAALSPRTHCDVVQEMAQILDYKPVEFTSYGSKGELIYHTNVMMFSGESFLAIGLDTVDEKDQETIKTTLENSQKEILYLENDQVYNSFAGNMIQVKNKKGERILVMSETANQSLKADQTEFLKKHNEHFAILPINTIETIGGGSARCMIAEVY